MSEFNHLTPLPHPDLDAAGLAKGTRIWMADTSFRAVQDVRAGDLVMGVTFRIEDEYLPRSEDPLECIVKMWRPVLCARRVLSVTERTARPWQLLFGDDAKMSEARRLVAGALTRVVLFPITSRRTISRALAACATALPNPRTPSYTLTAAEVDEAESQRTGTLVVRPTAYTGQPRGDMAIVIPLEAYAGQMGLLRTDVRPYNRYIFSQVRDVAPVKDAFPLYELEVQPDTVEGEDGRRHPVRANVIATTPFKGDKKQAEVVRDPSAGAVMMSGQEARRLMEEWEAWGRRAAAERGAAAAQETVTVERQLSGGFYASHDPAIQRELKKYGLDVWLDGGVLIDLMPAAAPAASPSDAIGKTP